MDKRYQVFVSSTYQDLQAERQEVMHALLELDCIPSGMELFPAANESQWSLIKRVIDECDYYVLILAGRYGSRGPEGISYTEMEYHYAIDIGKPTIAFLHKDPGSIAVKFCEDGTEGKAKLASFRALVEKKLCKHWTTPADLGSVVSRSLIQLRKTSPGIGWVRANQLLDKDATLELLKLRNRVDELEGELARVRVSPPKGTENLLQGNDGQNFRYTFTSWFPGSPNKTQHADPGQNITLTWNAVFGILAPLMINEASDEALASRLDELISSNQHIVEFCRLRLKNLEVSNFRFSREDFQTIKVTVASTWPNYQERKTSKRQRCGNLLDPYPIWRRSDGEAKGR